ncbi:acyl-CoA dehydrogenase family protein [Streptomyces sp. NBC_00366]|uniref:acyl-CoA dehydrogenase family protein n=1 Tax=Streptomyces sp. NBC_00366 TaxID=2975727 RepID=UPI002E260FBA
MRARRAAIHPFIRERALRTEQESNVPGEVVAALTDAGIYRMNVPWRYGGYQTRLRTQVDALTEIAAGYGSTAFTALIQAGCALRQPRDQPGAVRQGPVGARRGHAVPVRHGRCYGRPAPGTSTGAERT